MVVVSAALTGTLAGRIRHLAAEEHRLRREIEHGRERLEAANAQRQAFLAGMSHELRTPLNAIIGFADVLRERLFGPLTGRQEQQLERLGDAGRTMLGLVDEVLALDPSPRAGAAGGHPSPPVLDRAPALRADPRSAAAFFLLVPVALLAMPHHAPAGFHRGQVMGVVAIGAVLDAVVLLAPGVGAVTRQWAHVALTTVVSLAAAGVIGAAMAPFATMPVVFIATAASIRLTTRASAGVLALISGGEGILVLAQHGNAEPGVRWVMVTGTAIISAIVIRWMVNRMFDLAEQEAVMRRAADQARRDLEVATQHKLEFLRNIHAELREPVDVVTEAAATLAGGAAGPLEAKQAEYAADIASAGRHLWSLITDILDLATLELGTMPLAVEAVDVADLLRRAVGPFETEASAAGIQLTVEVRGGATVRADPDKVRRAVAGLVSNAIKFTPPGGRVAVSTTVDDGLLRIDVSDTGPGIPLEDRERIFDSFQQGAPPDSAPGTGVGLTLAQRFVELQGGRVELRSRPGRGSTFTVVLPTRAVPAGLGVADTLTG
jgi:signal transduction histidine kinase